MALQCTNCGEPTHATVTPTGLCGDCFEQIIEEVKRVNGRDDQSIYRRRIEQKVFEEILGNCISDEAASDASKKVINVLINERLI